MATYKTQGVCSRAIHYEIEDGRIKSLAFEGGCHGSLQGICRLAVGMTPEELIEKLTGVGCGNKPTSCPDQLVRALSAALRR